MKNFFRGLGAGLESMFTGRGCITIAIICLVAIICQVFGWGVNADAAPFVFFGMTALIQPNNLHDILKQEEENLFSREVVTVKSGQVLSLGAVIGKITKSTPTTGTHTPASPANTGSGTCTGVTAGAKTKLGDYLLTALSATAFAVKDPDGFALPDAVVGTAYVNPNINFTINNGSPAFAAGDTFTVTVAAGSGQVAEINFDAVDGSQDAHGVAIAAYDATSGAIPGVAIVREAVIIPANLVWPTTSPAVSAGQKAAALAQLAVKNVIAATEV